MAKNIIDVVVETPKGDRNKYVYDKKQKAFRLKKILPAGAVFPFDFGFIPDTKGEDGDPVDILLIMDEPAYPGCIVETRIIGALKAKQTEEGVTEQNDRIIGVAVMSQLFKDLQEIEDLNESVRNEISHFFISYNEQAGKKFDPEGWAGAAEAMKRIKRQRK
jgi:inorganic pyrophosphatase